MKSDQPSIFALSFHLNPNKKYVIEPLCAPKMALDVEESKTQDGANLFIFQRNNGLNQLFKFYVNKDLDCLIEACHWKNKVIDVNHSEVKNGTNIQLWQRNDTKAQLFRIIKGGEDSYTFLSSLDYTCCMDISGSGTKNKTNVQLYKRNSTKAQKFKLYGINDLSSALEYALKYADVPNFNYTFEDKNGANFCSQCLYAGGIEDNEIWNKNTETFKGETLLRVYFNTKEGIAWNENVNLKEINPGDIVYTKKENNVFTGPVFVIKILKKGIIYCGNNFDIDSKGILELKIYPGVLKTSSLFNRGFKQC